MRGKEGTSRASALQAKFLTEGEKKELRWDSSLQTPQRFYLTVQSPPPTTSAFFQMCVLRFQMLSTCTSFYRGMGENRRDWQPHRDLVWVETISPLLFVPPFRQRSSLLPPPLNTPLPSSSSSHAWTHQLSAEQGRGREEGKWSMGCAAKRGVQKTEGRKVGRAGSKNVAVGTSLHIVLAGGAGGGGEACSSWAVLTLELLNKKEIHDVHTWERSHCVERLPQKHSSTPPSPNIILNVWFQDNKAFHDTAPSAIEGLVMNSVLTSPLLRVCVSVHGVICSSYGPLPPTDPQDGWVTRSRTWARCCCGNISIFLFPWDHRANWNGLLDSAPQRKMVAHTKKVRLSHS